MHWHTLTPEQQAALRLEEEDLEIRALDDGIKRFHNNNAAQPMSQWPACRVMIATAADLLATAVQEETVKIAEGRGLRGAKEWGHIFLYVEPRVLAIATLVAMLDYVSQKRMGSVPTIVPTSVIRPGVGERIMMETHFTILKREEPRLKKVMERKIKKWDRRTLRKAMTRIEQDCADRWPARMRNTVGHKLVGMAIEHCGMFVRRNLKMKGKNQWCIRLTDEAHAAIADMNGHLEILTPMYRPMVVPPSEWAMGVSGGYQMLSQYHQIVKRSDLSPEVSPVDHGPMVYSALNALQATPWRVNQPILDTMSTVWVAGGGCAKIPHRDDLEIAPRPLVGDDLEWRIAAEKVHRTNARMVGRRLAFMQCQGLATEYKDRVFYFPHQCDFRGRGYPIPQFLQPQGNDTARGLLTFGDAKPLTGRGLWWLKVQYAGCWGQDKGTSFAQRVEWTNEKLDWAIKNYCGDPLNWKPLWADAKKPWQALASFIEIINAYNSDDPETYECSLPVSVDGSNSGLQHFSAMLRDPVGAKAVNLTASEYPEDIYSDVATCVDRDIRHDRSDARNQVLEPAALLTQWFGQKTVDNMEQSSSGLDTTLLDLPGRWIDQGIDRDLCKRGTMTYCYGVTPQGLQEALIEDGFVDWADNQFSATRYLGKRIWSAIQECITSATEVMEWLKKCAMCANRSKVLLHWRTPSGFHVAHPYNEPKKERVQCLSGDVWFKVYDPDSPVSGYKQRNGLPPNFVHSMDASHLVMTVAAGIVAGIYHFMMIHDSFGCHACDVDQLRDILRQQFVKLYSEEILELFRVQVIEQTGHDPGPPPLQGTFDLNEVLRSEYMFS